MLICGWGWEQRLKDFFYHFSINNQLPIENILNEKIRSKEEDTTEAWRSRYFIIDIIGKAVRRKSPGSNKGGCGGWGQGEQERSHLASEVAWLEDQEIGVAKMVELYWDQAEGRKADTQSLGGKVLG